MKGLRESILVRAPWLYDPQGNSVRSHASVRDTTKNGQLGIYCGETLVGHARSMQKITFCGEDALLYECEILPDAPEIPGERTSEGWLIAQDCTGAMWLSGIYPKKIILK